MSEGVQLNFENIVFLGGERIQIPPIAGHHRPASETPFKWCFAGMPIMAQHWIFIIFQGIRAATSIAKKPYSFVICGPDPLSPPPLDPRMGHEILVSIKRRADVSSRTRGLNIALSLYLHSYFVYASKAGSGASTHSRCSSYMLKVPKCHVQAYLYIKAQHLGTTRLRHQLVMDNIYMYPFTIFLKFIN